MSAIALPVTPSQLTTKLGHRALAPARYSVELLCYIGSQRGAMVSWANRGSGICTVLYDCVTCLICEAGERGRTEPQPLLLHANLGLLWGPTVATMQRKQLWRLLWEPAQGAVWLSICFRTCHKISLNLWDVTISQCKVGSSLGKYYIKQIGTGAVNMHVQHRSKNAHLKDTQI